MCTGAGKVPNKVPKVPEKVWEALVQSQVRFTRVPEKVPEKVPGSLGAKPSQVQQGSGESSGEGLGEGLGNLWCTARPGQVQWVQQGFQRLALQRFRQICENRILRLLGIPPKLILKEMEVLDPDT